MANIQGTSYEKMSLEHSQATKVRTSKQFLKKSAKSKMKSFLFLDLRKENGAGQEKLWQTGSLLHGEFSMLNIGESPNEENVSTLLQILQERVPERYYLSPKACQGILRRASVRGKELPPVLKKALEQQAQYA